MLIGVCSAKGSPGVSTTALALGARWPSPDPIVVEADPAGGDVAARFRLAPSPSLVTLAAASRRGADPQLLSEHCQRLPGGLRVVIAPIAARQAHASVSLLAPRSDLFRAPGTVVVDLGRVDPASPVVPLLRALDALMVLARPHEAELAHVATLAEDIPSWTPHPCLVLVGTGYQRSEVETELGIPVLGTLPEDPSGSAVLAGALQGPEPHKSRLGRAAAHLARRLLDHLTQSPHRGAMNDPPASLTEAVAR